MNKSCLFILLALSSAGAYAQIGSPPGIIEFRPPLSPPNYDSPFVAIIGDGHPAPNLPPIPSDGDPTPPPIWGPRAYTSSGRTQNASLRATITLTDPVIGGVVVGAGGQILLIRSIGPSLASFGITRFAARPQLRIYDSTGSLIASAVPWHANSAAVKKELKAAASTVGAFALPEDSEDQVLMIFLNQGVYTCVVTTVDGSTGTVLLETYDVPSASPAG